MHELNEDDPDRHKEAFEVFQHMFGADPTSMDCIVWSDEDVLKLNGQINKHNCIYWNSENPCTFCGSQRICLVSACGVPFCHEDLFDSTDRRLNMLQEWFLLRFTSNKMWYRHIIYVKCALNVWQIYWCVYRTKRTDRMARPITRTHPMLLFPLGVLEERVYVRNPGTID